MNIRNSTIASNTSPQPGNGISTGSVGSVANVKNTIVSNNSSTNCSNPMGGTISSQANNIDNDNSCGLNQPTDKPNRDPLLGPLANNGGQTDTHALLSGSPAIDTGDSEQPADQRGVRRPQDGDNDGTAVDDMGAFEKETAPPPPPPPPPPATAPVARPDVYAAIEDKKLIKTAALGVLRNDLGTRPLRAKLASVLPNKTTKGGTIALYPTGAFIYTPKRNFFGVDTFTYKATNSRGTSRAVTVTLRVASRPK
jgi:hypothetical protein